MKYQKIRKAGVTLLLLCFLVNNAKAEGIRFDKTLSWKALREKAKKENKYILMDCQTTWCGWCKKMEKDVFEDEKVGKFFNANFIPVSVQFDQVPDKDNDYIKSWYVDAKQINKDYPITGYPTCLIFSPDGKLVHRLVGYLAVDKFLEAGQKALQPDGQYFTLLKQYEAGKKSPEFLINFINSAQQADFPKMATKAFNQYFLSIRNPYTKENLAFITENTTDTQSKGFEFFLNNTAKVDSILGKNAAEQTLNNAIYNEVSSAVAENMAMDLDSLETLYHKKYPGLQMDRMFDIQKLQAALDQKDKCAPAIKKYMAKYGASVPYSYTIAFAQAIMSMYDDSTTLRMGLDLAKASMDSTKEKDPGTIYVYSMLLYKLGEKQPAVTWLERARDLVPEEHRKQYQSLIDKMNKGEKIE